MLNDRVFLIAEAGVNHEGSIEKACELIDSAAAAGADAIKFQWYSAKKLASQYAESYWDTSKEKEKSQIDLFSKYDSFGLKEYILLKERCDQSNIEFMLTVFDVGLVDKASPLVARWKIASADITFVRLLRSIASTKKPVILSTGASNISEIKNAVTQLEIAGCDDLTLLHCVLNYPTNDNDMHLYRIRELKRRFPQCNLGFSDHTVPSKNCDQLLIAALAGARVLETHYTYDKSLPGNDHYHACDAHDIQLFRKREAEIMQWFGSQTECESTLLEGQRIARENARRGLYFTVDCGEGHLLEATDLIELRPVKGAISADQFDLCIGKRLIARKYAGDPLRSEDFD